MTIVHTINELRKIIASHKQNKKTIGFIPTMGALHVGHCSLIEQSVKENDVTVISIFVNPIQFGPTEDFNKYPRTLDNDSKLAEKYGADYVFAPDVKEMFPDDSLAFIDIDSMQSHLCGAKRPGHFRGVCTIVAKFFNIVLPDRSYFGKKDIQQLYILKKMVSDLNFPVEIIACPIIREKNGLALSSRNKYLSAEEANNALVISRSLKKAALEFDNGETSSQKLINMIKTEINTVEDMKIDYIEIVSDKLQLVNTATKDSIIAIAAFCGKTRLIDNHILGEKICY